MKVLLIYPPFPFGKGMGSVMCSPPLNILTLAGAVPDHDIEILDLNVDQSYGVKEMEEKLKNYDLIGLTSMSSTFRMVLNICKLAKRNGIPTILGGFHPTLDPSIIEKFDSIDMIVRGEADFSFKEILDGKPKKDILGLSYRENGKVYHNPERPFIKNLDDLPYPRNDLVNQKPYHYLWIPAWVMETSRGCPFTCRFCCVTKFYKRTYRMKSPERVLRELYSVPENTKLIFFVDDNFTLNKKRVIRICKLIQRSRLNKKFLFVCQSRVDDIANNPDMVDEMHKAGFICFFFGFESFKQRALDRMEKGYSHDIVKKCIKTCHDNGIVVFGSFIIGNLGETKEDTRKTFDMMKELDLDFIMTMPITPFPGTELYDEALEEGWMENEPKWEGIRIGESKPIMRSDELTVDEIQELLSESYRAFYLDKKYLFKKYVSRNRTFAGNKKFNWTRQFMFKFIWNGITKFAMQLDEIVDDVYETA